MAGWTYEPWRGEFYPKGLRQADELAYASEHGHVDRAQRLVLLAAEAGELAEVADRDARRLRVLGQGSAVHHPHPAARRRAEPIANFFASGILALGAKLGPILWQLPPNLDFDPERRGGSRAAATHHRRGGRAGRRSAASGWPARSTSRPTPTARCGTRWSCAASFDDPDFAAILERHNVATVLGDSAGRWPKLDWVTADFAYARLHGDKELYTSGYDEAGIEHWQEWVLDAPRPRSGLPTSTSTTTRRCSALRRDGTAGAIESMSTRSPLDHRTARAELPILTERLNVSARSRRLTPPRSST